MRKNTNRSDHTANCSLKILFRSPASMLVDVTLCKDELKLLTCVCCVADGLWALQASQDTSSNDQADSQA